MKKTNLIVNEVQIKYPDIMGNLEVIESTGVVTVKGNLYTSSPEGLSEFIATLVKKHFNDYMIASDVKINSKLKVISNEMSVNTDQSEAELDEVSVIYYGMLSTKDIKSSTKFKHLNDNMFITVNNSFRVLGFISPIILNSKLEVIDGELRLAIAKHNNVKEVMVVIIDDSDKKADYLRLSLNRISEFQRWNYPQVDSYIDSVPQLQPLLEPIGFFGNKILPTSFFSNTVLTYSIDPFNEQQKMYSQDESLADWAKYRREQIKAENERAKAEKNKKKPKGAVSLFDLMPKAEDFVEVYDIDDEVHNHELEMRNLAGIITDNYDEVRKAEIESRGGVWQGTRRSSKQVAAANRQEFLEFINEQDISDEAKENIINSLDDVESKEELVELIEGVKNVE